MPFGAFAEIMPGVDGLIHISQIADHRIAKPEDELEVGQVVEAKIIDINDEKKRRYLCLSVLCSRTAEDYEDYAKKHLIYPGASFLLISD